MGYSFLLLPVIILLCFVIPLVLVFVKAIPKLVRRWLLLLPLSIILFIIGMAVQHEWSQDALYKKFPQANKITFIDPVTHVRDSIYAMKEMLKKLPRRLDHHSVGYSLDKHLERYHDFSLNWTDCGKLKMLAAMKDFQQYQISEQVDYWKKYVSADLTPFDSLTNDEFRRFMGLIYFLDRNQLSSMELDQDDVINLVYNDSLRMNEHTGFRKIVLDTTGYYSTEWYYLYDSRDGLFLVQSRN